MDNPYELVFCVVNAGFTELVMNAARRAGATGGTILKGRGTADPEAEVVFNIEIQPAKEIVMILVPAEIKDSVLRAVYDVAGLDSDGHGIAFSLPVERTLGIDKQKMQKEEPGETKK